MHPLPDIQVISAPSILGLKPGGVERLPESLLSNELLTKINSRNPITKLAPPNHFYSDKRTTKDEILNYKKLEEFFVTIKQSVHEIVSEGRFPLVLGGDCSILIGALAGLKNKKSYGLFFLDGHADFYLPEQSPTGEAADMGLAIISGKVSGLFSNIDGNDPYVKDEHIIHIGQRDQHEAHEYGSMDIRDTRIKCFDHDTIQKLGLSSIINKIKTYTTKLNVEGFWIHFDTDVISNEENPAVDYKLNGGLSFPQCGAILQWLVRNRRIAGMTVTIFNPDMDENGEIAKKITDCLGNALH